ncbi:hypothetical protein BX666DRAFT_1029136 [Dichotomocladium elegans]|nr:hypothetical protein BX666DRAFT_1029136 [Dichotomocladium elegans]
MSGSANRPSSVSPPARPQTWQAPTSPTIPASNARQSTMTANETDITVKQILEQYGDDPELLKHVLMAKAEEDKKQTAIDTLKVERARIQLRELDLELLREHNKFAIATSSTATTTTAAASIATSHDKLTLHPLFPPPPGMPATATTSSAPIPAPPSSSSLDHRQHQQHLHDSYYGLAPVQQQVLARITGEFTENHNGYCPRSPVTYPHSAHPLCPPSSESSHPFRSAFSVSGAGGGSSSSGGGGNNNNNRLFPRNNNNNNNGFQHQPTTPVSPGVTAAVAAAQADREDTHSLRKRGRTSISGSHEDMTHDQVMEALKAKIQRGNHDKSKRVRIPSPRSAKPILPPIDTSVGRMRSIPPPIASSPLATHHGELPPLPPPRPTAASDGSSSTAETAS